MSSLSDGDEALLIDPSVGWLPLEGKRARFPFAHTKRLGNVELAYANLDGRYFYRLEDSGQPLSNLFLTFSESIAHWSLKSR